MKTTHTLILALMAATGVVSGPLQKRMEVTTTTTETIYTTVTVDGPGETPNEPASTSVEPEPTPEPATDGSSNSENTGDSTLGNGNSSGSSGGDSTENTGNTGSTGGSETQNNPPATSEETTTTTPEESTTEEEESTTTGGTSTGDSFIDMSVNHHNYHRANHSANPLTWNEDIAGYAAITAATCNFAHNRDAGEGVYADENYGQNIAMWGSSGDVQALGEDNFIARTITEMWYNGELGIFPAADYGKPNPDTTLFEKWGHFSQVVWKDTATVGCAVQYCPAGTLLEDMASYFSVCNYYPKGNMGGEYGDNVSAPEGLDTIHA